MKRTLIGFSVLFLTAQFASSQRALAGGDCAACGPYFAERDAVKAYCESASGAPTTQRGSGRDGTTRESVEKDKPLTCEQRKEKFRAEYSIMAEQCEAWSASKEGTKKEKMTAVVYTASAAVCWVGCAWPAATGACTISGVAAAGMDLLQAFQLSSVANGITGVLSGGGQFLARKFAEEGAKKIATEAGKKAAEEAAKKAGQAAAEQAAKAGADAAGQEAAKQAAMKSSQEAAAKQSAQKFAACATAALNTVIAGLKYAGMTGAEKTKDQACTVVGNLRGNGSGATAGGYYGGTGVINARAGTNGSGVSSAPTVQDSNMNEGFMDGVRSAATADPQGPLGAMNLEKIPEDLQKLGITPQDISNALDSQSPGSFLGGMPGMTPDLAAAIKDAEKQVSSFADTPSIARSGDGGGGVAKKEGDGMPDFSALFGKKEEEAASLGATLDFKNGGKSGDNDIWHANWKGSIFQIVSNRLDKSRDKIDQLEWQSPLNRALTGLPSKPAEKK